MLGLVVAVLIRYGVPALGPSTGPTSAVLRGWSEAGWAFAIPFLALAAISYVRARHRRQLLDSEADLDAIRALHWRDFELLVGEAFRRQGFQVEERGGSAPDGGIDLVLRRGGVNSVVQCKRWKARDVGVALVRELYGAMVAEGAGEAIFVSSGAYSTEARSFAQGKPIRLIDGPELVALIRAVQGVQTNRAGPTSPRKADAPACPRCGAAMVKRTATTGEKAGQEFWGCSAFPTCRGTRTA